MYPEDWPEAESLPYLNVVGDDPQLRDPEQGDYRPAAGSPAEGYGCRTFAPGLRPSGAAAAQPAAAARGAGTRREASGELSADTLWDADTVAVTGDLLVADGVTLSIAPGVRVEFAGPYRLAVQGRILAVGEPEARIVFTSAHPEAFAVDSTQTGCWHGIHFERTPAANADSRLEHCLLEYAKGAGQGARGGALSIAGAVKLDVVDCVFRHNVADYGAVLFCSHFAAPRLTGCLLTHNSAFVGGAAVFAMDAYPKLVACTIAFNPVLNADPWYATGVLHNHIAKSRVTAGLLWSNPNEYFLPQQIREGKAYYATYSDIEMGYPGEGNFDEDPLFADQGEHPFALLAGSPCIDAGPSDTTGLRLPAQDLSGRARIQGDRVDAGAYEWRDPAAAEEDRFLPDDLALRVGGGPGRGAAQLSFRLAAGGAVLLTLHEVSGRLLAEVWRGDLPPGLHRFAWDGRTLAGHRAAAGLYLCRLQAGGRQAGAGLLWMPVR